jgi:hypothetical protein
MSEIIEEYKQELALVHRAHAGDTEGEVRALFLVALEREQLVTIAYSGETLHGRIDALPVDAPTKVLLHHAMHWAARDEDMHTTYVRGVLFRRGLRGLAVKAVLQQAGGLIAGWSSAISQHVTFSSAPISRTLAGAVSLMGLLAGKVPKTARDSLQHQSFRGFAKFNAEAEVCRHKHVGFACSRAAVTRYRNGCIDCADDGARCLPVSSCHSRCNA